MPARRKHIPPGPAAWDIDCELAYEIEQPTHFLFQIHAWHGADQEVRAEALELSEGTQSHVYLDPLSHHRFLRVQAPAGLFSLRYRASVHVAARGADADAGAAPVDELPDEVMHHLMPTRYCESDLLARAALKLFGEGPNGHAKVQAISDWVHDNVDYAPGSTDTETTACDVFWRRAGVCRDFAHLAVTFCRALNLPARLAVGYAPFEAPPPDFHAVCEAFIGGRWVLFDPTRLSPVEHLVRIASGRDAKDVAFATIFGPARMVTMSPRIERAR